MSGKRDLVPWEIVDMNPSPALSYEKLVSSHRASAMSLGETIKKTIVRATELDIKGF